MIEEVEKYCTQVLSVSKCKELPFHNLEHTKEVVQNVKYLCAAMDITQEDTDILIIAAWFHDTGFSVTYEGHEDESKRIAIKFLSDLNMDKRLIEQISDYIEATKMPQHPTTELAEILCDADVFHISTPNFYYRKLLLRRELETNLDMYLTDKQWHDFNLDFLKKDHFRSDYGRKVLEQGKQENIKKVKRILNYY
ncbi:HD domain-containing protein [uncultured Wocania sp.]|uniref:HD domain-containing protein n=1 Tax=uncultured Wocania sp. TaxID=2834404 RepID=UPI0030F58BFE